MSTESPLILIAEDAPDQVHILTAYILEEYPEAKIVSTGLVVETLEILKKRRPNILILDLTLKDGTGQDVLEKMEKEKTPCQILVVTGNNSEETLGQLLSGGADDYIVKPVDDLIFQSKLRSMLSGRYVSPLSFLGRREGLGEIIFPADIEVIYIDESRITFTSMTSLVKDSYARLNVGEFKLQVRINSVQHAKTADTPTLFEASISPVEESFQRQLRKYIFELN